jgi:hydrogenase maturation factor
MQTASVEGTLAEAREADGVHLIDLSLTGPVPVGRWVLIFLGAAREVLEPDGAARITAALDGLRALCGATRGAALSPTWGPARRPRRPIYENPLPPAGRVPQELREWAIR